MNCDNCEYNETNWLKEMREHEEEIIKLKTDRDQWKARAESLEKAIKLTLKGCECLCDMCKKERNSCETCVFEFDLARFSDKPTPCKEKIKCDRCGIEFLPINGLCICETCNAELEIQCQDAERD